MKNKLDKKSIDENKFENVIEHGKSYVSADQT